MTRAIERAREVRVVHLTVNHQERSGRAEPRVTLADFLRRELHLTGTHLGCEHGVCGACTVIVNGAAVRSCLMLAVQAAGAVVETVEGLADGGDLTAMQQSFHRHHALQCGYCTAGFLMSLTAALRERPISTEQAAREALSGNICRCTGYAGMVTAVIEASSELHGSQDGTAPHTAEGS